MALAVISDQFGAPDVYALKSFTPKPLGANDISLDIRAIGVSFVDVLTAAGKYQVTPPLPFIPGSECSGVIREVGTGVRHLEVGDRVMGSSFGGVFAETNTFRAASFYKIPKNFTFEHAAVFLPSYLTGVHALVDRGRIQRGESLLVLGAAGATGLAAIQVGKALGAYVIASASSSEKQALCIAAGADRVVNTRSEAWREDVSKANSAKPIDVVFDPVGGDMTDPAFRCLGYDGRYLVIGFTGGIARLKTNLPLVKTASLIGVQIRAFGEKEPDRIEQTRTLTLDLAEKGLLLPAIGKTFLLKDFQEAMCVVENGKFPGRILLTVE